MDLPVCLAGELRNITCDVVGHFDFSFENYDTPNEDDYPGDAASRPELSPTRVQTLLGLAVMLFVIWFSATRGLPQQGTSQVASVSLFISVGFILGVLTPFVRQLYSAGGLAIFDQLAPRQRTVTPAHVSNRG